MCDRCPLHFLALSLFHSLAHTYTHTLTHAQGRALCWMSPFDSSAESPAVCLAPPPNHWPIPPLDIPSCTMTPGGEEGWGGEGKGVLAKAIETRQPPGKPDPVTRTASPPLAHIPRNQTLPPSPLSWHYPSLYNPWNTTPPTSTTTTTTLTTTPPVASLGDAVNTSWELDKPNRGLENISITVNEVEVIPPQQVGEATSTPPKAHPTPTQPWGFPPSLPGGKFSSHIQTEPSW